MKVKNLAYYCLNKVKYAYGLLFHKRNIIIVSERQVQHMPISGAAQCAVAVAIISGICWASYSTGSYFAVRGALKEKSLALKSVVGNKVDSNFAILPSDNSLMSLAGSKAALSSVDNAELFSRIADLEERLKANEESRKNFIEKVQQKAAKNIDSYENLIEQTGLDVSMLKKHAASENKDDENNKNSSADSDKSASSEKNSPRGVFQRQGGPYIPDEISSLSRQEQNIISQLDELSLLKEIVENLPVRRPIRDGQEVSGFGRRIDPFTSRLAFHAGVDLAGAENANIHATSSGVVKFAGRQGAYGNMIDIDHGYGISTRYAHLSRILVDEGVKIKKGQIIGIQGSTGRSTGAHLHYEVRYKDRPLDPRNFFAAGRYVPQV